LYVPTGITPRTLSVLTSACITWFTVPSPPAATKRRRPSFMRVRTTAAQLTVSSRRITSSPASRAVPSSSGGSFTPEHRLRSIKPLRLSDMNRIFPALIASFFALSLFAADAPKECALCVGAATDLSVAPATPVPQLVRVRQDDLAAAGTALDALSREARAKTSVVVSYSAANLDEIEAHTKAIIEWAKAHGPFDAIGIAVDDADAAQKAYAVKRLAVSAQGQGAA